MQAAASYVFPPTIREAQSQGQEPTLTLQGFFHNSQKEFLNHSSNNVVSGDEKDNDFQRMERILDKEEQKKEENKKEEPHFLRRLGHVSTLKQPSQVSLEQKVSDESEYYSEWEDYDQEVSVDQEAEANDTCSEHEDLKTDRPAKSESPVNHINSHKKLSIVDNNTTPFFGIRERSLSQEGNKSKNASLASHQSAIKDKQTEFNPPMQDKLGQLIRQVTGTEQRVASTEQIGFDQPVMKRKIVRKSRKVKKKKKKGRKLVEFKEEQNSETVKEVFKLTTTRYQGMLEEEYNEDDLEIMKVNSERNMYNNHLKKVAFKRFFFVLASVTLFVIDSEVTWAYFENEPQHLTANVVRAFSSTCCLFSAVLLVYKHYYISRLNRIKHIIAPEVRLIFNFIEFPAFFLEFLVMILHFPPFLDQVEFFEQYVNDVIIFFTFLHIAKLISCLELIRHYSPLNTSKGRFVGSLSKTEITKSFLIKAWVQEKPLLVLPLCILVFWFVGAYVTYVVERSGQYAPCFEYEHNKFQFSFRNTFWMTVISFLTVGYGDIYPLSITGRFVNTIVIVGGMIASATIIGLVHEQTNLSNEENHILQFIKTRKKEKTRKKIALKLVTLLMKMQVQRVRQLNLFNIKWKNSKAVIDIRNQIYKTIKEWKAINQELYIRNRRDSERTSELNNAAGIEEALQGIVSKGIEIWESLKTDKMQKQLNIETSFMKSQKEVQRIINESQQHSIISQHPRPISPSLGRFKTQRSNISPKNLLRIGSNTSITKFEANNAPLSELSANTLSQNPSKQAPQIRILSLEKHNSQSPPENVHLDIDSRSSQTIPRFDLMKNVHDREDDEDMISESLSDSSISHHSRMPEVILNSNNISNDNSPTKDGLTPGKTQNDFKRTRTVVPQFNDQGHQKSKSSGFNDLVQLRQSISRQKTNLLGHRDNSIIEEDFEEDQTTPLYQSNEDFAMSFSKLANMRMQRTEGKMHFSGPIHSSNINEYLQSPNRGSLSSFQLSSESPVNMREVPSANPSTFQRKTTLTYPKKRFSNDSNFELSYFKSDRSLIDCINNIQLDRNSRKWSEELMQEKHRPNIMRHGRNVHFKGSNMKIEKQVEITRRRRTNRMQSLIMDNESYYGGFYERKKKNKEEFKGNESNRQKADTSLTISKQSSGDQQRLEAKEIKLFKPSSVVPSETVDQKESDIQESPAKKQNEKRRSTTLKVLIPPKQKPIEGLLNIKQQPSSDSTQKSMLQLPVMHHQFGGKSPIKYFKQNTGFSIQSAEDIQKILDPMKLNLEAKMNSAGYEKSSPISKPESSPLFGSTKVQLQMLRDDLGEEQLNLSFVAERVQGLDERFSRLKALVEEKLGMRVNKLDQATE